MATEETFTSEDMIEAVRRLLYGIDLTGTEASEIIALVLQNVKRDKHAKA